MLCCNIWLFCVISGPIQIQPFIQVHRWEGVQICLALIPHPCTGEVSSSIMCSHTCCDDVLYILIFLQHCRQINLKFKCHCIYFMICQVMCRLFCNPRNEVPLNKSCYKDSPGIHAHEYSAYIWAIQSGW